MRATTVVVTGANSGVGFASALEFARSGASVVMVCRDKGRGEAARRRIAGEVGGAELVLHLADLSLLDEVRDLGTRVARMHPSLDVLVNNAAALRARKEITPDGLERTFAVNHFAPFLLSHLLASPLRLARGRIVNVSSEGHRGARLERRPLEEIVHGVGPHGGIRAYCDTKAANILFTRELARRNALKGVTTCAVHPGSLATGLWNQNSDPLSLLMRLLRPFMGRPSRGALAVHHASAAPAGTVHGRYLRGTRISKPAPIASDTALGRELWDLSLSVVGLRVFGREEVRQG